MSMKAACAVAGIPKGTIDGWRSRDPAFDRAVTVLVEANARTRSEEPDFTGNIVLDPDKIQPPKPAFKEWRRTYLGRSVPPHHEEITKAVEDLTNQRVFILAPPGSGKDTTAGDFCLYFGCDNFALRVAWIMKGEAFSRRRLSERLAPSLTDPKSYRFAPAGADSTVPTRSLIEDYGPYEWDKRMVWSDGQKVDRTTWNKNEMYFVGSTTLEADPNLWATGIGGALYGARVDLMVVSDPFDRENDMGAASESYVEWFKGTMRTRLDDRGRLIVLGTRLRRGDSYEALMKYFIGNARVVYQDGHYTKYNNGVATVIFPAIQHNDEGEEVSYWPDKFPLDSHLVMPDGTKHLAESLTDTEYERLSDSGAVFVQGLRQVREDDPDLFETMYQQNPPADISGEFTDVLLEHCVDPSRTFGVAKPGTMLILGVDPARSGGAAWWLWEWDREAGTSTLIDYFFGEKLGTQGIKEKLILDPIRRYMPRYLVYESNRESAILDMVDIQKTLQDYSVTLIRRFTSGKNRGASAAVEGTAHVAAMTFDMRNGVIRFPGATVDDLKRLRLVNQHFHNWDDKQRIRESKRGVWHQIPDDITMAAWVGWAYIAEVRERGPVRSVVRNIPEAVRRTWKAHTPSRKDEPVVAPVVTDLRAAFFGGDE